MTSLPDMDARSDDYPEPMRAVVFDFFGTLTDPSREASRRAVYDATAAELGVRADHFWSEVTHSFTQRATGVFGDTRNSLKTVAERCAITPTPEQLDRAVSIHHEGARLLQAPRSGALDVLRELRSRGFRLALLSDCCSELCELWGESPYAEHFDITVFSWEEGFRKPDPRGFARAAQGLEVPPEMCWFVGDGGSRELAGARDSGMRPVLVTNAAHTTATQYRDDPDSFVPSDVVADVTEIPALIGQCGSPVLDVAVPRHRSDGA
jgi:putative hydrolase of the HAD superfamily